MKETMMTFFAAGRSIPAARRSTGTAVTREIRGRAALVRLRYVVHLCCGDRIGKPSAPTPTASFGAPPAHTHRLSEHLTEPMFADDANEQLDEMLLNPDIVAGDLIRNPS
jgi:hypothetical protein